MKVSSSRFGNLEVAEEALVTFPSGLVGFPSYRRFVVLDVSEESEYQWLQSVDDAGLAFILMNRHALESDCHIDVPEESLLELDLRADDHFLLLAIVTIPSDAPEQATANLRAPILVNLRTRRGKQLILHESIPLRFPLIPGGLANIQAQALVEETASVR